MADSTTDAPQGTNPFGPVSEETPVQPHKEETAEGVTETTKPVFSESVLSMFGGGSKPKREEKAEEDDESKGKSKKEEEVSSPCP